VYVNLFHTRVKSDHVADFVEAMRVNYEGSIREPGHLRFDVLQSVDDPTRFVTYMAYSDESGLEAHRKTEHYLEWRDKVADWMAEPRYGDGYRGLFAELD
jgi:(4S)-4-hydroxy-5-phosphonooxypentane-2,3-dione isomerase